MRRLLPVLLLALCAACWLGPDASAQPRNSASSASSGASSASSSAGGGSAASAAGRENCGTPDEFRPCPPMPRVPLREYPANR